MSKPDQPERRDDAVLAEETLRLAQVMATIRRDCVWTQQIDHRALLPYLLEESAELVDAVEAGTTEDVVEELGDVLWQVVFHAEIAASTGEGYELATIMRGISDKMVRRHTHVFGDDRAETIAEVEHLWGRAKAAEKAARRSALDGVPSSLSAMARAQKVLSRVDGAVLAGVTEGAEAAADTETGADAGSRERALAERYGAELLTLVARARADGVDAEGALREQTRRLEQRQREHEAALRDMPE